MTLDSDFHTFLAMSGDDAPSVIRYRVEGLAAPALVRHLLVVLDACQAEFIAGAAVVVERTRARIRMLPLP